jgi:methylmalonyl-CoA mutase cobalamin-binding subunit
MSYRVLVAKPGLDGHDRAPKLLPVLYAMQASR